MDKKPEDKPKAPASPAGAPPKKKKKKLDRFAPICIGILIVLMGLTFLQSLFGNRPNKVSSISESVTTYPSTETNPAETQTHSYALQSIDENELKTLATYFREHYYGFFLCDYNQPQSIDWSTVLVYVDAPQTKIPEEIKKSYLEKIQKRKEMSSYLPIILIRLTNMSKKLQQRIMQMRNNLFTGTMTLTVKSIFLTALMFPQRKSNLHGDKNLDLMSHCITS